MPTEAFISKRFSAQSQVMIARARQVLQEYAQQGYDLSLRQLYYQFVSRAWLPNSDKNYKALGSVISDARMCGLIDWDMIRDRGRSVVSPQHWTSPASILNAVAAQYAIDKWEEQPNYIEVMVEKQALEGVLIPVCTELDICFTANKGYSSSSAMYEASKRFIAAAREGKDCYVLYLGDHDPSGIDMTRDVLDRLDLFMFRSGIEVNRLALNMEQVEEYNPPPNPAKLTDSRAVDYISRYGDESWELDALNPSVLADLVREAVEALRDDDLWEEALERERLEKATLSGYADQWHRENDTEEDDDDE